MKGKIFYLSAATAFSALLLVGCSKNAMNEIITPDPVKSESTSEETAKDPDILTGEALHAYVKGLSIPAGTIPAGTPDNGTTSGEPMEVGTPTTVDNDTYEVLNGIPGYWSSQTKTYRLKAAFDETILFDPAADIIYPGCVLKGSSIADGTYAMISNCKVGDVTFSISMSPENPMEIKETAQTINNIRLSEYQKVYKKWASMNWKEPAVKTTLNVEKINNQKELMAKLGAVVKTQIGDFAANFGLDFNNKKSHLMAQCIQKFYTVSADAPKTSPTIFSEINKKYMDETQPVYISNINYGRMVFITLSSDEDEKALEGAFKFALSKIKGAEGVDVNGQLESTYKRILARSEMRVTIVGGDSEKQTEVITGGLEAMTKFLNQHVPMEQMQPISFNLRYAADNANARIVTSTEYTVTQRNFVQDFTSVRLRLAVKKFSAYYDYANTAYPLDKNSELVGNIWMKVNGNKGNLLTIAENAPYSWNYRGGTWKDYELSSPSYEYVELKRAEGQDLDDFTVVSELVFGADLKHVGRFPAAYGTNQTKQTLETLYNLWKSNHPYIVLESNRSGGKVKVKTYIHVEEMQFKSKKGQLVNYSKSDK